MMAWVAERVAEQRLLWNLRSHDAALVTHPDDLPFDAVMQIVQQSLRADYRRHARWLVVDTLLFIASGVFFFVPGPNIIAYYFAFRVVGHWLSMRGAAQGRDRTAWSGRPSPSLTALRAAVARPPHERDRAVEAIAQRARPAAARHVHRSHAGAEGEAECLTRVHPERSGGSRTPGARSLEALQSEHVKLRDLAARLGCRLEGDGDLEIVRVDRHPRRRARRSDVRRQSEIREGAGRDARVGGDPADGRPRGAVRRAAHRRSLPRLRARGRRCSRPTIARPPASIALHGHCARRPAWDRRVDRPVRRRRCRRLDRRSHGGLSQRHHRAGRAHRRRLRRSTPTCRSASAWRSATASCCRTAWSSAATATASCAAATARTRRFRRWRRS